MSDWREFIILDGISSTGAPEFAVQLFLTDPDSSNVPPTDRMVRAVRNFYLIPLDNLNYEQAHALLCFRDYSELAVEEIYPHLSDEGKALVARLFAIFISADDALTKSVIRWSEINFTKGVADPTVKRTKSLSKLDDFYAELDRYLFANNIIIERI